MPNILRHLRLTEVSSVDQGAGEGVDIMLMKRNWTEDERREAVARGEAMSDGSFPIATVEDLRNAIDDYGRAGSRADVKAHIMERARALGATDQLPPKWKSKRDADGNLTAPSLTQRVMAEFSSAIATLKRSVASIINDKAVVEKGAALTTTLEQFEKHIQDAVPTGIEKALSAAADTTNNHEDQTMTDEEKAAMEAADKARKEAEEKAAEEKAEHEKTRKALAKAERLLKLSDKHRDYMSASSMSDEEKDAFAEKTPAERDAHIERNPINPGAGDDEIVKRLPEHIQKQLADSAQLRKDVEKMKADAEMVALTKRATEIGLPETDAVVLQKARHGDVAAVQQLEERIKAAYAAVKAAGAFNELGTLRGHSGGSAAEAINSAAAEMMKSDRSLTTIDQAIAKIADSAVPEHQALWKSYRAEEKGIAA